MSNPFDDDVDDDYFKKPSNARKGAATTANDTSYTYTKASTDQDEDWNFYEKQIEDAMQSSLASTQRSMRALEESEAVGVGTAEVSL